MRIVSWNLNHRAARRSIPAWVAESLAAVRPDVAILTEYVPGLDHDRFCSELTALGLPFISASEFVQGNNSVLIGTREEHSPGPMKAPPIYESIPPNVLHVVLGGSGLNVLGIRIPDFSKAEFRHLKRPTWNWLLNVAAELQPSRAVIAGDLNTALGDRASTCGGCLEQMASSSWTHAIPPAGSSWYSSKGGPGRRIDHAFASPSLRVVRAEYDWDFRKRSSEAAKNNPGCPDHAMLIVDLEL